MSRTVARRVPPAISESPTEVSGVELQDNTLLLRHMAILVPTATGDANAVMLATGEWLNHCDRYQVTLKMQVPTWYRVREIGARVLRAEGSGRGVRKC